MVFSAFLRKPFNSSPKLGSQSGQAVIEYILVLCVVVAIALGVVYQLSGAFKKYVESYFGDYVACLLETGELPALGGSTGASAGSCNALYQPFSLSAGRPLNAGGGGGMGSNGKNGANGKNGSTLGKNSKNSGSSSKNSFGNASGGGSGSAVKGPSSGSYNGERSNVPAGATSTVKKSGSGNTGGDGGGSSSRITLRARQRAVDGQFNVGSEEVREKAKENTPATRTVGSTNRNNKNAMTPQKVAFDPAKTRKPDEVPDSDVPMTFGSLLRYLIIAGIVIAIIVVFGGQLLQVRRNQNAE